MLETEEATVDGPANGKPTIDAPGTGRRAEIQPGEGEPKKRPSGRSTADGYEILAELGRGGMGIVYQARQIALNRLVALKVIKSAEFASEAELIRFQNEAEAVAQLDHPHIVPIYEVGQKAGQRYFSMKLIDRAPAWTRGWATSPPIPKPPPGWWRTVAEAIHHAHQRGILHRDLKPANILLDERGQPHVTDFGLASHIEAESEPDPLGLSGGNPLLHVARAGSGERRDRSPRRRMSTAWARSFTPC